jgi:soluble lytic murein transglycosylase-like protein
MKPVPSNILDMVLNESSRFNMNPALILAVIDQESGFHSNAIGSSGEIGLMQIMPSTGQSMGYDPSSLKDPSTNIECGVRYLKNLQDKYSSMEEVLQHYNGAKTLDKAHNYIASVTALMAQYGIYLASPQNVPYRSTPEPTMASFMKPQYFLMMGFAFLLLIPPKRSA